MSSYGFNPGKITIAQNGIQSAYNLIFTELNTNFQTSFIDAMAATWACPVAKKYFTENVLPAINDIIDITTKNYSSFQNIVKQAGESWATSQEYNYTGATLETKTSTISIKNIKDEINGLVGIVDDALMSQAVTAIGTIKTTISGYLEQTKSIIANNEAFLGGDQQAQLTSLIAKVTQKTDEGFSQMETALKQAIEQTITDYQTKSTNISNSLVAE